MWRILRQIFRNADGGLWLSAAASALSANVRSQVDERQASEGAERQQWVVNAPIVKEQLVGAMDGDSIKVWRTAPLAQVGDVVEFRGAFLTSTLVTS